MALFSARSFLYSPISSSISIAVLTTASPQCLSRGNSFFSSNKTLRPALPVKHPAQQNQTFSKRILISVIDCAVMGRSNSYLKQTNYKTVFNYKSAINQAKNNIKKALKPTHFNKFYCYKYTWLNVRLTTNLFLPINNTTVISNKILVFLCDCS